MNGYGYDVVGYTTVGMYTEHFDNILTAYEKFHEFRKFCSRVELVDLEFAEVFEEWEAK